MRKTLVIAVIALAILATGIASCVHKPTTQTVTSDGNFPTEIANIMVAKCAVAGCHNAESYTNASNLRLDTWSALFDGDNSGAAVVPYSPAYSPLLYFVNTDATLGPIATPTMPVSTTSLQQPPLTKAEYLALQSWIAAGAPDKNGNIAFASDAATRQKIYITQQGCDLLAVVDAQSHLVMRYIPIGASATKTESPHCVRVSSDGMYAYASFLFGNVVQKIDTRTDQVTAAANVGALQPNGSWNIVYVAPADTAVVASNWQGDGLMAYINSASMNLVPSRTFNALVYPHGITSNPTFDTFFITAQYGNVIYKISADGNMVKEISLNGATPSASIDSTVVAPNPHEILMSPDYSRYFVTCQTSNEVRIMDAHSDTIIAHIPVGSFPQEIAISSTEPYLFVTCMEDATTTVAGMKGSVYAINYNTLETRIIYGDFYQPHGIAVDDKNGTLYIVSTNANPTGPAPHHATSCNGRAGWYSVYNLHTLLPLNNKRYEVTVMPYSAAPRFR